MFRECTDFEVYPLGYEHTVPGLRLFRDRPEQKNKEVLDRVINNIKNIPDFLITKPDKSEAFFVEVKYRSNLEDYTPKKVKAIVEKIHERWDPVWLFLATPNGFYFDSCNDILNNDGRTKPLTWINSEIQNKYLEHLMRFEKPNQPDHK